MTPAGSASSNVAKLARALLRSLPFAALLAIYGIFGHLDYVPAQFRRPEESAFRLTRPLLVSGDEPHYMLVINSLLFDHDVRLDRDFERVHAGGSEAGSALRGSDFGGHSLLVDPATGRHVRCVWHCDPFDVATLGASRFETLFQVPAHPIAYPVWMAALALPFRPSSPIESEPLVGRIAIVVAFAGIVLAYACARRSGLAERHAALAAALVGLASPWLVYLRSYYSEPSIGLFVALGFLALRADRPILAGLGAGVAMAMKPVFVLVAGAWIAERLWAKRPREAILLAGSVGLCGIVLLAANTAILRTPLTSGGGALVWATDLDSLIDTFFDPKHGLFAFAPWTILSFVWGLLAMRRSVSEGQGRLAVDARRQIVLPVLLCTAAIGALGWGPGYCYGPRYYVPFLPLLALLAVDFALDRAAPWRKVAFAIFGLVSLAIAVTSVLQYRWLFSHYALASLVGPQSLVGPN